MKRSSTAPRHCIGSLLALGLAACGGAESRPNILLVTLDTTRPDYMGTYGYEKGGADHTPHFDALAAEGVRFDMAISASAVTPVSHASILTGTFPYTHGLRVLSGPSGFRLPAEAPILSSILKDEGYATGAVHSAFPVSSYFGFERDFDFFDSMEGSMKAMSANMGWDTDNLQRRSDDSTDVALGWLRSRTGPFFLWVHYWDPHDPILLPPDDVLGPELLGRLAKMKETGQYDARIRDRFYAREVHYLDSQFGRLVEGMKELGVYDDTIIALTADHGEGLSDGLERHQWPSHRMVYQEQIRVPLILRLPTPPQRRVVGEVVRTVDIVPTLVDYAGIDVPDVFDGASLRPLIAGRESTGRVAYADQINAYDANASMTERRPDAKFLFCVVDGPWKLTYRPHMWKSSELFHLGRDPEERHNVINEEQEVFRRMMADLARREPWVLKPFEPDGSADPDAIKALEGLGYAGGADGSGGGSEEFQWRWTCPAHLDARLEAPGSHAGCGQQLVPVADEPR